MSNPARGSKSAGIASRRGAALALVLAPVLSLAAAGAQAQVKWNMPSAYPPENIHTEMLTKFIDEVKKETGGKLAITNHNNASLFKATEIKRAVMTGQAQAGEVLMSIHENEDPIFGVDVVPFLVGSLDDATRLYQAAKPAIEKKLASQKLVLLYSLPWPTQGLYSTTPVMSTADLKGAKWRAYNVGTARIAELVGAQPVTIQAAELPQALATGAVSAWMSSGTTGYDVKVWESQKHFYDMSAWVPRNIVFVNKAAFDALDAESREGVKRAAAKIEKEGLEAVRQKTDFYYDEFRKHGMKVEKPSAELKAGLEKVGEQLQADWLKKAGATGEEVLKTYRAGK